MNLWLKNWLQLGRAQTWPATWLLIMTPYLHGKAGYLQIIILSIFLWFIHLASFGHNSLMDMAMGYDQKDPSKSHHPLITGALSLSLAHNVIHWGLSLVTVLAAALTVFWSFNVGYAMVCLMAWVSFGHSYNDGLSKESLLGFLSISFCMTAMGGWGWFMSHQDLNRVGWMYLAYVFFTILFQISWSGFIKEIGLKERSNILTRMGAHLEKLVFARHDNNVNFNCWTFKPGSSRFYAWFVKGFNLFFGGVLLILNFSLVRLVAFVLLGFAISFYLHKMTKTRVYNRKKELMKMSMMEILTIYLAVLLMLDLFTALILMVSCAVYFFAVNRLLWGTSYPKV